VSDLLLDTHIWLWALLEPQRLAKRLAAELESTENELWLSPISFWELIIMHHKGRMLIEEKVQNWIARAMRARPLKEAPVTFEVAREVERFEVPQRDPADRFLVATARVFNLTLVTADQNLIDSGVVSILANR
jgi:PIN domain nuclease of toxin-antitoxin system